jgi:hypothetical protein
MTRLDRTSLELSEKINCAARALVTPDRQETISGLSREFGISRPTLYEARDAASSVLEAHFKQPEGNAVHVVVDEAQLKRCIVAMRAMSPTSIRGIEDMLPFIYPGVAPSYGTIQSITSEAEVGAAEFNRQSDLSRIDAAALDEMFSQGDPVLAGVDLDSGYLFDLSLRASRSGADWAEVLEVGKAQGLDLSLVVKDAGAGIDAGVREAFPDAERRDDCFHALYEMNKVQRQLEQKAYAAIALEHEEEKKLGKIRAKDKQERAEQKRKLATASKNCLKAIERYERFAAAKRKAHEAMEYIDVNSGQLRTGEQSRRMIETAADEMQSIDYGKSKKVACYIRNRAPGLSLAITDLHTRLQALFPIYTPDAVCLACLVLHLLGIMRKRSGPLASNNRTRHLLGAFALLKDLLGEKIDALFEAVEALLEKHHRASSAIEGFNAALRPHLYVHKGVTQNFLELFRAYYNLRTRRSGRHKGTSPHQCLTGSSVYDWLSLIGFPPSSAATVH